MPPSCSRHGTRRRFAAASTTIGLIATGIDVTATYNDYQISTQNLANTQANFAAGTSTLQDLREAESTMNWSTFGVAAAGLGGIVEAGGLYLNVAAKVKKSKDILSPETRMVLNQAGTTDSAIDNVDSAIRTGRLDTDTLDGLYLKCKKSAVDCANEINTISESHRIDNSPSATTTRTESCALNVNDGCRYYFEGKIVSEKTHLPRRQKTPKNFFYLRQRNNDRVHIPHAK